MFGDGRGTPGTHRCASCGTRTTLYEQPDGLRLCTDCATASADARALVELDAQLRNATEPLLANLAEAGLEQKVEAHRQASELVQTELTRLQTARRAISNPSDVEAIRLDALIAHTEAYYLTVQVQDRLPQRDENKLIRRDLQIAFPNTKFSVSYRRGYGVSVAWTDGPAEGEVEAITKRFVSESRGLRWLRRTRNQVHHPVCRRQRRASGQSQLRQPSRLRTSYQP